MDFHDVVTSRRSVKKYDPSHLITDQELERLFSTVVLSPSSFNLQHWRFVVIRDPAGKKELRKRAYDQVQVEEASAAIVVCAKLTAHTDAARIYADAPADVRDRMVPMIEGFYTDKPQMQRDEAIRGASLAAMTLMLTATEMGYGTSTLCGFWRRQAWNDLCYFWHR